MIGEPFTFPLIHFYPTLFQTYFEGAYKNKYNRIRKIKLVVTS